MKTSTLGLGIIIAIGSLAAVPVQAQQSTATSTSLDEIVVTATKREEKLHDVAMSITALGGEDLQDRQLTSYTQFAAQVPGLSLQAVDAGTNRLILRGQNTGSVGATVATTVDDIPFFMSGAQANGAYFGANIDTYDLRRIEVLRGPQGTLYGAAAEGGLIKYVTNPPNPQASEFALSVGGESVDGGQIGGIAKGMFNLPFWDNKAALRVSAVRQQLPGWIDNPLTGRSDANGGRKYSLRGSLLLEPTTDLSIRLTAFDQGLKVDGNDSVRVVGAALNPAAPPANQFDQVNGFTNPQVPGKINDELKYYALNLEYRFPAATLLSATSYGKMTYFNLTDGTNINAAPGFTYGDALGGIYAPQAIVVVEPQRQFVHKFNQELRITSNPGSTLFGNPFDWQGGAFFTHETTLFDQSIQAWSATDLATVLAPPLGGVVWPADYKETAIFADLTYHFSPAFDIEVGGRTTRNRQHSQAMYTCCVLYGPADTTFSVLRSSQNSTTWSAAPRWHVNEDVLVYARIATGFRPGGPNLPVPGALPVPPAFLADRTRNYELGLRADVFDKRFSIDVAAFDIEWTDVQVLSLVDTAGGTVGINGNSGRARSRGFEWNFSWRPLEGLSIGLLGAYTDAKLTTNSEGLGALSGDKLPYVPDISGTLNLDYKWQAFAGFFGTAGASWSYIGSRYTDFSISPLVESHVKLPTYNTLQLRAGLDNGHYSAQLYADNLTNTRGLTEYNNQSGADQTGHATFIRPRTIGLELGMKF